MFKKFTRSKYFTVFLHVSVWMIIFILPLFFRQNTPPPENIPPPRFHNREYRHLISTLMNISFVPLFYLNAFLLVPRFFNKRSWYVYLFFIAASIIIIAGINIAIRHFLSPNNLFPFPAGIIVFISAFVLVASTAFHYIQQNIQTEELRKEKEAENFKTELSFLRSQVSPHFLFNTLNNLVSLARKKSDLLEPSLLKLSGILQYMLYESDDEKISIHKEIDYLNNYIELQKLRFGSDIKINFLKEVSPNSPVEVVPMILIPFVENAFKHGVVFIKEPEIIIRLVLTGNFLTLNVKNKYNLDNEEKDKSSGIGLNNVKRRLNLLYPDNHKLEILQNNNWHIANLSIIF